MRKHAYLLLLLLVPLVASSQSLYFTGASVPIMISEADDGFLVTEGNTTFFAPDLKNALYYTWTHSMKGISDFTVRYNNRVIINCIKTWTRDGSYYSVSSWGEHPEIGMQDWTVARVTIDNIILKLHKQGKIFKQ